MNIKNKSLRYEYLIFLVAIIFCYFNVIRLPQIYYDDFSNVFTPALLGEGFNPHSILNALMFHVGGFRPISYLSFYLNHYLFNGNLRSFVIINVIIHFLNTIIFYKIAFKLTKNREISFLTSLFWAVSPVNLFAVSYIVQRMTSLMALFGGIGTLYYLNWEETKKKNYLIFAILFVILSTLSKENGILFLGLFIVHYYIKNGTQKDILEIYLTGFLFLIFWYIFCKNYFVVGYIKRGINPIERFLTELRVLVFYIQNIIFPFNKNIFLIINLPASKSLFQPITTLFSLIFILILIGVSFFLSKKDKIISIGILGFFLFHIIESTFMPLLQAFWHRNYVASFFLILAFLKFIFSYKTKIVNITVTILILNATWVTILHNLKWQYKPYYVKKNYERYPQSLSAKNDFANELFKEGKLDKALNIYSELLNTNRKDLAFIPIIEIFHLKNLDKEALALAKLSPTKGPNLLRIIAICYTSLNQPNKALLYFQKSLDKKFEPSVLFYTLSLFYMNNNYDKVIFIADKYQKKLTFKFINNNKINKIYNLKNLIIKILLLKIECEVKLGLKKKLNKDVNLLKKHKLFTQSIKNYINALICLKQKKYPKAIQLLKAINCPQFNDLGLFLMTKKRTFMLCINNKTAK